MCRVFTWGQLLILCSPIQCTFTSHTHIALTVQILPFTCASTWAQFRFGILHTTSNATFHMEFVYGSLAVSDVWAQIAGCCPIHSYHITNHFGDNSLSLWLESDRAIHRSKLDQRGALRVFCQPRKSYSREIHKRVLES